MNKLVSIITFFLGSVIGAGGAYLYLNETYQQRANEEIAEVKAYYAQKNEKPSEKKPADENPKTNSEHEKIDYRLIANNYSEPPQRGTYDIMKDLANSRVEVASNYATSDKPYIISGDEFADPNMDYTIITLNYYADDILADDNGDAIERPYETVGAEALTMMHLMTKNYESHDSTIIYVRNDKLHSDFEIALDLRTYHEVYGKSEGSR